MVSCTFDADQSKSVGKAFKERSFIAVMITLNRFVCFTHLMKVTQKRGLVLD